MAKLKKTFARRDFERQAWQSGQLICGIDEAGRGCLAGPVVAAAAILVRPTSKAFSDSKLMTAPEREAAYTWLTSNALWAVGIANHRHIDAHNIYQASRHAMLKALCTLTTQYPQLALSQIITDAMPLQAPWLPSPVLSLVRAESASLSVAAASIIAKVTRDRIMQQLACAVPGYQLQDHKGYGTPTHCRAMQERGRSLIHRASFVPKHEKDERAQQISLFEQA